MSQNSLASTYSRALGLEIDKPFIYQSPYALPFENYIVIGNSSGNPCKNYDYYQEVINFTRPYLENVHFVQLGGKDDLILDGCFNLCGKTSLHQSAYILANAKLTISNDTQLGHISAALGCPTMSLFGATSVSCHGPHWHGKFIGIESHRGGQLPSFRFDENPKTVNFIKPEEVVKSIFNLLEINKDFNVSSINIGERYNQKAIEAILDQVIPAETFPNAPLNIRYDYLESPQILAQQLQLKKCLIITDKIIDLNLLKAFKSNILALVYQVKDDNNPKFVNEVRKSGIQLQLVSNLTDDELNKYKLNYFDIGIINIEKITKKDDIKDKDLISDDTYFKTNKMLLSKGKFYSSKSHWLLDLPKTDVEEKIINTPKFWEELDYFYLYKK